MIGCKHHTGARRGAAVGVISRLPRRGRSKTRLARALGPDHALALHRAFLDDELEQLRGPWALFLVHDRVEGPADQALLAELLSGGARSLVPGENGLARELRGAFRLLLGRFERAVIVSGDVPHLSADRVSAALAALDDADLVLATGPDGGYALIGLRESHDVFTTVPMGTRAVERATLQRARSMGLRARTLAPLADIDEAQDLLLLEREPEEVARRTRAVVSRLERGEHAVGLPAELQIEVTNRCNLKCSACLRSHEDLGADADLSLDDLRALIDPLPRVERVTFQLNGEPLLSAALPAVIAEVNARGARTVVNTNGVLLDARRRGELIGAGLDELRVSLDGVSRESALRMSGADVRGRVLSNVRALVAERGAGPPRVSLWMIATRSTIAELPRLVEAAAEHGADEVYVQRLVITGRGTAVPRESLHGRVDARVRAAVAEAEAVAARTGVALRASGRKPVLESLAAPAPGDAPHRACWRPWRSAVVTAHGQVLPCCISSFVQGYAELGRGDLSTASWSEVWNGAPYRSLRRGILEGKPLPCCARCGWDWSL